VHCPRQRSNIFYYKLKAFRQFTKNFLLYQNNTHLFHGISVGNDLLLISLPLSLDFLLIKTKKIINFLYISLLFNLNMLMNYKALPITCKRSLFTCCYIICEMRVFRINKCKTVNAYFKTYLGF